MRKLFLGRLDVDAGAIQRGMSQQTRETDQITGMCGEVVGRKGMAEPVGAYLPWEAWASPYQLVDHPSHGRNTELTSLLTDPEWTSGTGGPGTSDRFERRFDLQERSHIPSQGRPCTRVEGHGTRFVALATADEHLSLLFSKADIPPGERSAFANAHASQEQELHQGQITQRMAGFRRLTQERMHLLGGGGTWCRWVCSSDQLEVPRRILDEIAVFG